MRLLLIERVSCFVFGASSFSEVKPGCIRQAPSTSRAKHFCGSDRTLSGYGSDVVSRIEIKHIVSKRCGTDQLLP